MIKDIVIKNMDDFEKNPYSIEEYIDTLSKWNTIFEDAENWEFIQRYLLEGMYCSLGEILRDNYAYFSIPPTDKKFAYAFEFKNNYQFKYGTENDKLNLQNLLDSLAGFGIFQVVNFDKKKYLVIQDIAIRPDLQHNQLFQDCLKNLLENSNKYFGCEPDFILTNIHNDNQPSKKAFAKLGIDEKNNLLKNNPEHLIAQYKIEFEKVKQAIKNLTSQEPEKN